MRANYCIKCGTRTEPGNFCPYCGAHIEEFEMPQVSEKDITSDPPVSQSDVMNEDKLTEQHDSIMDDNDSHVHTEKEDVTSEITNQNPKKIRWCPECFNQIPFDATVCPYCHHKLSDKGESL